MEIHVFNHSTVKEQDSSVSLIKASVDSKHHSLHSTTLVESHLDQSIRNDITKMQDSKENSKISRKRPALTNVEDSMDVLKKQRTDSTIEVSKEDKIPDTYNIKFRMQSDYHTITQVVTFIATDANNNIYDIFKINTGEPNTFYVIIIPHSINVTASFLEVTKYKYLFIVSKHFDSSYLQVSGHFIFDNASKTVILAPQLFDSINTKEVFSDLSNQELAEKLIKSYNNMHEFDSYFNSK